MEYSILANHHNLVCFHSASCEDFAMLPNSTLWVFINPIFYPIVHFGHKIWPCCGAGPSHQSWSGKATFANSEAEEVTIPPQEAKISYQLDKTFDKKSVCHLIEIRVLPNSCLHYILTGSRQHKLVLINLII